MKMTSATFFFYRSFRSFAFAFLFLVPILSSAQTDLSKKEVKELRGLKKELEGTYQVQMIGTEAEASLMLSVYEEIAARRDDKKVVHYRVDERTRIKILPKERIEAKGFQGVEKRVVHIEEKGAEQ